jgi:sugar transferase EpsL
MILLPDSKHAIGKRLSDILLSIPLLAIATPIMGLTALLVLGVFGRPILFRQERPGLNGRPFVLYKFRTMADVRDSQGRLLPDAQRLKPIGRFLRSVSFDELPELFNVLRGDMSLVGPRPLLMEYLCRYSPEQARRHDVKPGITGWAQVNGRNALSWEERFRYDVWYVDNRSLILDFKILGITLVKVIKGEGINKPGQATMSAFEGSDTKSAS